MKKTTLLLIAIGSVIGGILLAACTVAVGKKQPPPENFRGFCEKIGEEEKYYSTNNLPAYCIAIFMKDIRDDLRKKQNGY